MNPWYAEYVMLNMIGYSKRIKSFNVITNNAVSLQDGSPQKSSSTAKSQSPLAFTPTSVMRKMTADREKSEKHSADG